MDELVLELLANPPLTAEELGAPAAPVGPLSVAPCGRCLASVGVRSFVDADEIREASVLISCSGHPYLKALAGFGDDRGGINLAFEPPAQLASSLAAPGASASGGGVSALLRTSLQLLEFVAHARMHGVALLALPQGDVGVTSAGHLSVLALRHAVAAGSPPSSSQQPTAAAPPLSLQQVQRALRGLQPGSPVIRQLAPETLAAVQAAQARYAQARAAQSSAGGAAPAAPLQPSAVAVAFDADRQAAYMCGVFIGDMLGAYTAAQASAPAPQQQHASDAEQHGRRVLLQLVAGLTQAAPDARWTLPTALAALEVVGAGALLPPPPLPPQVRLLMLTVQLPPPSLQQQAASADGGSTPADAASPAGGAPIVRRVVVPVAADTRVGALASRALAAAQGRHWTPAAAPASSNTLSSATSAPAISLDPGSAHIVLQVAGPQPQPQPSEPGLLPAAPQRTAALLHPASTVAQAWDLLSSPDAELLPIVVVAAGAMVDRLKRLPVLAPQLQHQQQQQQHSHLLSDTDMEEDAAKHQQHHHAGAGSAPAGGSPLPGDVSAAGAAGARVPAAGSPATVVTTLSSGGNMTDRQPDTPPRNLSATPPPGHQQPSAAAQAGLTAADFPPVGSSAPASAAAPAKAADGGAPSAAAFATVAARGSPLLATPAPSPPHAALAAAAAAGSSGLASGVSTGRSSAVAVASPAGTPLRPAAAPAAAAAKPTAAAVAAASSTTSSASVSSAHGGDAGAPQQQQRVALPAGSPQAGFPTVIVSAGGPAAASASHDDAAFVLEAVSRLRPFGLKIAVTAGRITMELPRVPAAPQAAALVAAAASKASASARDARVTALRELLRDLQDRSHTRDDGRLAGFGALGFLEVTLGALFACCFLGAKDEQAASFALQVLGNLAMNDANRVRLADLAGIELVGGAMGVHAASARVQKDAIVALRHLAYENDANKLRIVECGAAGGVVKAMTACADSVQVQRQACGALSLFAVHSALGDAAKRVIVTAGGLPAIVKALQGHMSDTQLATAALKALGSLVAMPDARNAARELGALELCETLAGMGEHAHAGREFNEALRQLQRRLVAGGGGGK